MAIRPRSCEGAPVNRLDLHRDSFTGATTTDNTWLENPYWQFFTGETYLQTELPIDPSSLTRWRKRIGEEGVELLLAVTIEAARTAGLIKRASLDKVIVDTTVMSV